ncbi:hypothetical protein GOODEAATRI_002610 [Goodea atripinnis]|uniref:Uncharacterized protein n=1 Tax=Goodea atripinnis TaxID=208336 RepID=A0ABV0PAU4_9TELE
MAEGQQGLAQCCGGEDGGDSTAQPGMSPCCEEASSDSGAACPSQCRTVALDIDPAYNNYYFRRLSDSALDSEPSTPVRGPPLLGMEKVFIEIEDVERDALLDDEAFDGREGLPLPHFGTTAEGTAAQTCSRGLEPLEELRLRLEFSTKEHSSTPAPELCFNTSPPSEVQSASLLCSQTSNESSSSSLGLLSPCGPLCDCANCAASAIALLSIEEQTCHKPLQLVKTEDSLNLFQMKTELQNSPCESASDVPPELMSADFEEETPAVVCYPGQQQESLLQLRRSGLVRRQAEKLERLTGLSLQECQRSNRCSSHSEENEDFSSFTRDFAKTSTPCQVRLEPLVVPLTNEALLGVVGSGLLTPTTSPHGSTLTRSSSSDSLRSIRGKPGLVRQRAQEIETRMRLAGLTVPSRLKRSNSLAKLGSLNLSSDDLCSVCSSDAGTLLLLSLSPEPDQGLEWDSPTTLSLSRPRKDLHTPERALLGEPRS